MIIMIMFLHSRLPPQQTLFAGLIKDDTEAEVANTTLNQEELLGDFPCGCQLSSTKKGQTQLNEVAANRFFKPGSLDRQGSILCCKMERLWIEIDENDDFSFLAKY